MQNKPKKKGPLAYRTAPQTLEEFHGQSQILGEDKLLYRMIKADRLSSMIFWGPPGCGKTSLAKIIAKTTEIPFEKVNAVTSGVAELKELSDRTERPLLCPEGRLLLFVDEIHRFNKAQQDVLLPATEDGSLIIVGATTENPYFEVNKALLSRMTVFRFELLKKDDIKAILLQALKDERGYGDIDIDITDDALDHLAGSSAGDARTALNRLEASVLLAAPDNEGVLKIDQDVIKKLSENLPIVYDKAGDAKYDNISAMIKSVRGGDPDAALFYMAKALTAGEDPLYIARRIVISSAEDVGLANPQMLSIAMAAYEAVERIGMPEGRIILSQALLCCTLSPKSNSSYRAVDAALAEAKKGGKITIPMYLRNAPISDMKDFGYAQGYLYPHDFEGAAVPQEYLPEEIRDKQFYHQKDNGYEARFGAWMREREELKASFHERYGYKFDKESTCGYKKGRELLKEDDEE